MAVNSVNLYGTGPDAGIDQSQILRAQQLAQLLQQQANAPIESPAPNAPMSWTQGAAKLAEGLAARKQNQKVSALQKDAVAKQQALIQSLFPQQPMAATPLGDSLAPGAGVMQSTATPGATRPGLPSLTGDRNGDIALASDPRGGLQAYLQSVAASREKEKETQGTFHVLPKDSVGVQGGNVVATGQPDNDIVWKDNGSVLLPYLKNGQPAPGVKPIPKTPTPEQSREAFDPRHAALLAAMAARGVTLPSGLRSKEQMKATLDGLVKKYPTLGDDEIADNIANGKINFSAQSKAAQVAGAQAGKVQLGLNEIQEFSPIVLDASSKLDRDSFVPLTKLMQMGEASISNPNLRDLKIAITSMLNAYDQVAARGGTDKDKRAEAHALLLSADSPEVLQHAVAMFQREAEAAERAAQKAMTRGGSKPEPATSGHPADIQAILDSLKK